MSDEAVVRAVVERVRETLDGTVAAAVRQTFEQVPAYAAASDPTLRSDLHDHVDAVFRTVLDAIARQRPADPHDFGITAAQATRRVAQGVSLADFLRAYRINQVLLWESVVRAASADAASRDVALHLATHVMQAIEIGSTVAAEAYLLAQQYELAESDRIGRDLVEDLLVGREPGPGPARELAAGTGLDGSTRLVVSTTVLIASTGSRGLREVLQAIRGAVGSTRPGLAVLRRDEVVGVAPLAPAGSEPFVAELRGAHRRLQRHGVELATGVSTVHAGPGAVARGHAEAVVARTGLAGRAGVVSLSSLGAFDYLIHRPDETVRRLIRPELRRFVEQDVSRGGALVETLRQYVANDMNATLTASAMHMHVNTAYYRLERIAERTGCDLRRFTDVQELLIAVLLLARSDDGEPPAP